MLKIKINKYAAFMTFHVMALSLLVCVCLSVWLAVCVCVCVCACLKDVRNTPLEIECETHFVILTFEDAS